MSRSHTPYGGLILDEKLREWRLLRERDAKLKRLGNMKRIRRLYRVEGLQLRHRVRRRKHASLHRGIPPAASRAHERWGMDFVHDALIDSRTFRVLTVVDQ